MVMSLKSLTDILHNLELHDCRKMLLLSADRLIIHSVLSSLGSG